MSEKTKSFLLLMAVALIIIVIGTVALNRFGDETAACPKAHTQSDQFEIFFTGPEIHAKSLSLLIDGEKQLDDANVVIVTPNVGPFNCKVKCERGTLDQHEGVALCINDNLEYEFAVQGSEAIIIQ